MRRTPALSLESAKKAKEICEAAGARAKISSIHVNAWFGDYDKLSMSELFLSSMLGWDPIIASREAIFVGDSPNDEPMFRRFELSCGVANLLQYEDFMVHLPAYITEMPYGAGFAELCSFILANQ